MFFFTVDYLCSILFCIVYYIYTRINTNGQLGEICPGIKTILHASILVWDCNYSNYACKCLLSFVIRFCLEYFVHRKNVTIDGQGLQNNRVLAHLLFSSMKESVSIVSHLVCDRRSRFLQFHPMDRPNKVAFYDKPGILRTSYDPDLHGNISPIHNDNKDFFLWVRILEAGAYI